MNRRLETVLETFTRNEIAATDNRIAAIRIFVSTLKSELTSYAVGLPNSAEDNERSGMVLRLFRNMIETYGEELNMLVSKREQMLEHLSCIHSATTYPVSDKIISTNLSIN